MNRGRRIYFNMSNGEVLHDTGEAQGDIKNHPAVMTDEVRFIDLPYGYESEPFHKVKKYHIDPAAKNIVFDEFVASVEGGDVIGN